MTLPRLSTFGAIFGRASRPFPVQRPVSGPRRVVVDAERYLELVNELGDRLKSVTIVQPDIQRGRFAMFEVEYDLPNK